jgi:hypothetical protein
MRELLGSLVQTKGVTVLVIVANVVQEEILELALGLMKHFGITLADVRMLRSTR